MASFLLAFKTILPLFLIILAGVAMIRLKAANAQWSEILSTFLALFLLPAWIAFTA